MEVEADVVIELVAEIVVGPVCPAAELAVGVDEAVAVEVEVAEIEFWVSWLFEVIVFELDCEGEAEAEAGGRVAEVDD